MKILLANDHGGLNVKNEIQTYLISSGHDVVNLGVDTETQVDYPDIAFKACKEFTEKKAYDFGILFCGTGIGISVAANKIKGIRCAVIYDLNTAEKAKAHNNANFIAFGGRVQYHISPIDMLKKFMDTEIEGGRHAARIEKLEKLELSQALDEV